MMNPAPNKAVREYFAALGRANGSAGGKKAAANMTTSERKARATKAVAAREAKRALRTPN